MPKLHRTLITLIVTAAFALPVAAQESADGNPATGDSLAMGETTETQIGETYVVEEHGDWMIRCVRVGEGQDPCQLYQLLNDAEGNAVAEMSMFPVEDGGPAVAGATIVTPLETLLTEQLRLSIDGSPQKIYPFNFCNQIGCYSRVGFTDEELQSFKQGTAAVLTIVPAAAPDQNVPLTISLTGFTAGFEGVVEANKPQTE